MSNLNASVIPVAAGVLGIIETNSDKTSHEIYICLKYKRLYQLHT